jgi:hypothetical protein
MGVFERNVLRRMFGTEGDEMTGKAGEICVMDNLCSLHRILFLVSANQGE